MKYVALNIGLGGLFTKRTSREIIEGYSDPVLTEIATTANIYKSSDPNLDPFISSLQTKTASTTLF